MRKDSLYTDILPPESMLAVIRKERRYARPCKKKEEGEVAAEEHTKRVSSYEHRGIQTQLRMPPCPPHTVYSLILEKKPKPCLTPANDEPPPHMLKVNVITH